MRDVVEEGVVRPDGTGEGVVDGAAPIHGRAADTTMSSPVFGIPSASDADDELRKPVIASGMKLP